MTKISGIYLITNVITNTNYVGSGIYIKRRISRHLYELTRNIHKNRYLQRAWNKYGKEAFIFIILQKVEDKTQLVKFEQSWINWLDCVSPKGYNLSPTAGSTLGIKATKKHIEKNSKAQKGKKLSEKTKEKIRLGLTGRKQSEEHRNKRATKQIGRILTEKTKKKISQTKKRRLTLIQELAL